MPVFWGEGEEWKGKGKREGGGTIVPRSLLVLFALRKRGEKGGKKGRGGGEKKKRSPPQGEKRGPKGKKEGKKVLVCNRVAPGS